MGKYNNEINLSIKSGVSANDYSSVAKSKDLEPIDFELDKLLEKQSLLNHFNKVSQENYYELNLDRTNLLLNKLFDNNLQEYADRYAEQEE